jgi:DNA-binding transcriptional LysR family regulator
MHLRNLKVFCDVVQRHSFSLAAADNGMTQSGVSQAVQQLEEHLGVKLIDRRKRPFVLTAEGDAFYAGCVQIMKQFDNLTQEVRGISNQLDGRVTVAAIYSVGLSYVPRLQALVRRRMPKALVRYQFCHPEEVYRLVEQGVVDFGMVSYPESTKTITVDDWCEERMVLVASRGHRLGAIKEIQPSGLADESLVAFAPRLRIRQEIDRYLRFLGVTMQVVAEFDNIDSVKHALEVNAALAFLPEPTVEEELKSGEIVAIDCPWLKLKRPLGVIQPKGAALGPTARCVLDLILQDIRLEDLRPDSTIGAATENIVVAMRAAKDSPGCSDLHSQSLSKIS